MLGGFVVKMCAFKCFKSWCLYFVLSLSCVQMHINEVFMGNKCVLKCILCVLGHV